MGLNIIFIWSNSLLNSKTSISKSDAIKDAVVDIIKNPDNENNNNNTNSEQEKNIILPKIDLSVLIRKAAHFFEFMLFGMILFSIKVLNGKPRFFTINFICLATAVLDEFIQSFSDRTDSIKDVLIDFSGSVTGIFLIFLIYIIVKKNKDN